MAKPVTDDERARIIELIESGMARNDIAAETGRSNGTISGIAKTIGWTFGQSNGERARETRSAYCAERRASIAATATEKAEQLLAQMDERFVAFNFGGKDNTYNEHELDRPPVDAVRAMVQSVRDLMRTVIDIDRHDNKADDGLAAVDQWLRGLIGDEAAA